MVLLRTQVLLHTDGIHRDGGQKELRGYVRPVHELADRTAHERRTDPQTDTDPHGENHRQAPPPRRQLVDPSSPSASPARAEAAAGYDARIARDDRLPLRVREGGREGAADRAHSRVLNTRGGLVF